MNVQVRLLGPVEVVLDGALVPVAGRRTRALLALLALHGGRPVLPERCIDGLWGEEPPSKPVNALQARVSELRRLLGAERVVRSDAGYALAVDEVDVERFERSVTQARSALAAGDAEGAARRVEDALVRWRGVPLADVDAEFVAAERTRLIGVRLDAVEVGAEAALAVGEHERLLVELPEVLADEPHRERLWELYMGALYRAGRQAEALDAYQDARRRLAEDLGLEPGQGLREMESRILSQDPSLGARASLVVAARSGGGVRKPVSTFVGRGGELDALAALLDEQRLVTLTGPGGVGKTRLALEVADRVGLGAVVVELATSTDGRAVPEAVAAAVGLRDVAESATDVSDRLIAALGAERRLVVLDNCEHVVAEAAAMAERLVTETPTVVLATSREPLGVPGEQQWPVDALAVPAVDAPAAEIAAAESVVLFLDRARQVRPDLALDGAGLGAVAEVVRRLDGLPLAVELAAARVAVLPPAEIARRLDDRFGLLRGGARTVQPRQQTLEALVGWSYELLFDDERRVFEALSVFAGGASLDDAVAHCAEVGVPEGDVIDLLERLVAKSLLVCDLEPAGARYRMLETLRAYGAQRLADRDELEGARLRHARRFAALASRAAGRMRSAEMEEWLGRLDAEQDNVAAAVDHAVDTGDAGLASGLAADLGLYWTIRASRRRLRRRLPEILAMADAPAGASARAHAWGSLIAEADHDFDHALEWAAEGMRLAEADGDDAALGLAAAFRAVALLRHGDPGAVGALLDQAEPLLEGAGDDWGRAVVDLVRGAISLNAGRIGDADDAYRSSLRRLQALDEPWGLLRVRTVLGVLGQVRGDYAEAAEHLEAALTLTDRLGWGHHQLLGQLANVRFLQGRLDEAADLHERAVVEAAAQGAGEVLAFCRNGLGLIARRRGHLDEARSLHEQALTWWSQPGWSGGAAFTEACLGFVAEEHGDLDRAVEHHRRSLRHALDQRDPRAVALALEGTAAVAAAGGDGVRAATLLGAADNLRAQGGAPLPDAEQSDIRRASGAARRAMGDSSFDQHHDAGARLSLEEAVALVLEA